MRPQRLVPPLLALVALLGVASPVAAGGVAIVVPATTDGRAVNVGEKTTVTFTLLQHSVSPVDFGNATVIFTDIASGESFRVAAQRTSVAGGFEASFTYPRQGWWTWHVEHDGLVIESPPIVVGIFGNDGPLGFYPGDGTRSTDTLTRDLDRVTAERDSLRGQVATLTTQLQQAMASSATTADRAASAEGRPTLATLVAAALIAGIVGLVGGVGLMAATNRSAGRSPVREINAPVAADLD